MSFRSYLVPLLLRGHEAFTGAIYKNLEGLVFKTNSLPQPQHLIHLERDGLALGIHFADRVDMHLVAHHAKGSLADEDLPGTGVLLDALGGVDAVTYGGIF